MSGPLSILFWRPWGGPLHLAGIHPSYAFGFYTGMVAHRTMHRFSSFPSGHSLFILFRRMAGGLTGFFFPLLTYQGIHFGGTVSPCLCSPTHALSTYFPSLTPQRFAFTYPITNIPSYSPSFGPHTLYVTEFYWCPPSPRSRLNFPTCYFFNIEAYYSLHTLSPQRRFVSSKLTLSGHQQV